MLVSRRWDAALPAWRFPSPGSRESHKTCSRCAHLFSRSAPAPAACTQNAFPDQNTHTACRSAARSRIWGKAQPEEFVPAPCRTARNAKQRACPAYSPGAAPCCNPFARAASGISARTSLDSLRILSAAYFRGRRPDIRVDGTWLPLNLRTMAYCLASRPFRQVLSLRNFQMFTGHAHKHLVFVSGASILSPRSSMFSAPLRR
jgi:hypothetical protein